MNITRRIVSLAVSAALLLSPCAALAEGGYVIPAGQVTATAISDAYVGGLQIDVTVGFSLEADEAASARAQALRKLLEMAEMKLSFYDDFGTARVKGALTVGGAPLLTADALIAADGSIQAKTNLTGDSVLAYPAGGGAQGIGVDDPAFAALPAKTRLAIALDDLRFMLMGHLLGWISYTQRDTGKLYVFDNEPVPATDTRDAVSLRMVTEAPSWNFFDLLTNILWTLRDECGPLEQALADVLAEAGVTRYQVRQFVDGLLTEEKMDPAEDWVQPSATVYDDGALCTKDDIEYTIKKLDKSAEHAMDGADLSPERTIHMTIGYDDGGAVVGYDLQVPQVSSLLPYEGDLVYSVKSDEREQRRHTAHGELELLEGNRLAGDLDMWVGRDVDGVNANSLSGYLEVRQSAQGTAQGVAIDGSATYRTDGGDDAEAFDLSGTVSARINGEPTPVLSASAQGETSVSDGGFLLGADARVEALGMALTANVSAQADEYDGIEFAPGPAIDLSDPQNRETVKQQAVAQLMGVFMNLTQNEEIMSAVGALLAQ